MFGRIKKAIQGRLYKNCIEEYHRELRYQTDPYLLWVTENEQNACGEPAENVKDGAYPAPDIVYMEDCGRDFSLRGTSKDFVIFVSRAGRMSDTASREIMRYFDKHENTDIVYADEDVWMLEQGAVDERKAYGEDTTNDESAHRIFPWTKPMWSPDTLFSFLYFGNIFAVRRNAFLDLEWLGDGDYKKNIYDFVLKATERGGRPGHIEKMLFHAYREGGSRVAIEEAMMHETDFIGVGGEYDFIRESAFARRGVSGRMAVDKATGISYPVYEMDGRHTVSIIIPSKDNTEVLKQCIRSIYAHTDYSDFEIIVVDNGSTAQARISIENFRQECPFTYLYIPMEFNFSAMCNAGVRAAKGEYVLLLNDDMEIVEPSWLARMAGQASLRHVGAVGAKLLYPGTTLIQHAGITNTIYGPGHKLKKLDDKESYYYGRNRFVYDMVGVTAACLLMRMDYYKAMGGLYEGLAVAYNDVDLCFRLCGKGLYNVIRNDVVLYHHESLSRGDDLQDENKLKRLIAEQEALYKRHPEFHRKDPFIGTLLNDGEPEYGCRWPESYELLNIFDSDSVILESRKLPAISKMNQTIRIVVDECGLECFSKAVAENGPKKKSYYLIKGWAYVPGADNARYKFKILLVNDSGRVWELPVRKRYRKDVAAILTGEVNVELTGFCNWISDGALPPGTYDLWLTAKDRCSRQRLFRSMERQLVMGGD